MPQAYSQDHQWVVAATVPVSETLAKQAARRGTAQVPAPTGRIKVDALDVYCEQCRRPWDDVAGEPCVAAENRDHLIGGPTGERKKRKHPHHDCQEYGCTEAEVPPAQTGSATG